MVESDTFFEDNIDVIRKAYYPNYRTIDSIPLAEVTKDIHSHNYDPIFTLIYLVKIIRQKHINNEKIVILDIIASHQIAFIDPIWIIFLLEQYANNLAKTSEIATQNKKNNASENIKAPKTNTFLSKPAVKKETKHVKDIDIDKDIDENTHDEKGTKHSKPKTSEKKQIIKGIHIAPPVKKEPKKNVVTATNRNFSNWLEVYAKKYSPSSQNDEYAEQEYDENRITNTSNKRDNKEIVTETMALLYEKEGKFDSAINIYKQLKTKNPQKSALFAKKITALEKKQQQILN